MVGAYSADGLARLLKDLRSLSEVDFKAVLAEASGGPATVEKKKAAKKTPAPRRDSPVARVASALREGRGLADQDAKLWLQSELRKDGVDPARIPAVSDGPLESWLQVLFKKVRSADALAVAQADTKLPPG